VDQNRQPTDPVPHLPHLDSLRGIAALLVVLHHAYLECRPTAGPGWAWLAHGHFLVTAFLILSGYCLALPTLTDGRIRGGLVRFARRRALRILPAYYVALAGSMALVATLIGRPTGRHWDFALPVDRRAAIAHVLMIHNLDVGTLLKINHVFWSIAVECQIYLAFPLMLWSIRRFGIAATVGLALALGYLGHGQVAGTARFGLMPHYYGMFGLGILAAHLAHVPAWRSATDGVSWWTLAGLALLATGSLGPSRTYEVLDLPLGLAFAAALVALAGPGRVRRALGWRPLVALGGVSYSLYLIHAPLQHLLVDRVFGAIGVGKSSEFPALALGGTAAIVALSFAFHRAFERPFLPRRSRSPGIAISGRAGETRREDQPRQGTSSLRPPHTREETPTLHDQ
jgi:peptidoglycan/LPS O-acetylase OafA/YrhL